MRSFSESPIFFQVQLYGFRIQNADGDLFPVMGGQGGDPQIQIPPLDPDFDAPVLGDLFFGDVHARHDLDPRGDRPLNQFGEFESLHQDAVDPLPDLDGFFPRFKMNIAGLIAGRVNDDAVHEPDNRGGFAFADDLFDPLLEVHSSAPR